MKHTILSTLTAFMVLLTSTLSAEPVISNVQNDDPSVKVAVYYFHYTARCVTCKTVEKEAETSVKNFLME